MPGYRANCSGLARRSAHRPLRRSSVGEWAEPLRADRIAFEATIRANIWLFASGRAIGFVHGYCKPSQSAWGPVPIGRGPGGGVFSLRPDRATWAGAASKSLRRFATVYLGLRSFRSKQVLVDSRLWCLEGQDLGLM